jgi:hypothetical protein
VRAHTARGRGCEGGNGSRKSGPGGVCMCVCLPHGGHERATGLQTLLMVVVGRQAARSRA